MAIVLLISYILIFTFLIITLIKCFKKKIKWYRLFLYEIISIILSIIFMTYYDSLPGYGFMPGLSYLGEVLISFGAIVLFSVLLVITIFLKFIIFLKKKETR